MTASHLRPTVLIFAVALAARVAFLVFVEQPPVQFDARQYVAVAVAAPLGITHPSLWSDSTARDQIDFARLFDDVVDDEIVHWFPYGIPTYEQSLDYIFFSGPVYPAFLSAAIHLAPRHDFRVIRFLQAIIDSFSAVLLFLIVRRLSSATLALVAASLYVIYPPALLKVGELLTEIPAIFLTLLAIWVLLRAFDTQKRGLLAICGGLIAILALTKASTSLLIIPLLLVWVLVNRNGKIGWVSATAAFLGAWMIVMLPWFVAVHARYGEFSVRDPSYGGANFRQANIVETEGYNVDAAPSDFWTYPVWREISAHPLAQAHLYLQKFRRLWWRASDDYRIFSGPSESLTQWGHRLILLFALPGILLWRRRAGPVAWFPIAVVGYFSLLHTAMHVVSRYNLLAMPLVCGAAAVGAGWLIDSGSAGALRRFIVVIVAVGLAVAAILVFRPPFWLAIPGTTPEGASFLYRLTGFLAVVATSAWVVTRRRGQLVTSLALGLAFVAIVAQLFFAQAAPREGHAEWHLRLNRPGIAARRTIRLPAGAVADSVAEAAVLFDAQVERKSKLLIRMTIDGIADRFSENLLDDGLNFYPKPNYRSVMEVNGDRICEIRNWSRQKIDGIYLDSVLSDGEVEIGFDLVPDTSSFGALRIFGDLPQQDPQHWIMPGMTYSSVERYQEDEDPRIWDTVIVNSQSSKNARIIDGAPDFRDLSGAFGRQSGEYRIFLQLLFRNGETLYY